MEKEYLERIKQKLSKLSEEEKKQRDLYLRKISFGQLEGPIVGYPSIDKPWLKNYTEKSILQDIPKKNVYEYMKQCNVNSLDNIALDYEFVSVTYKEMYEKIDEVANSLVAMGINEGDTITSCIPNLPEAIYLIFAVAKIGAKIDLIDPLTNGELLEAYCINCNSKLMFTIDVMSQSAIAKLDKGQYNKVITVSPMESLPIPNETEKNMTFNNQVLSWGSFLATGKKTESKTASYKPDMPLAILHTGGTTAIPKGAVLSHDNMISFAHELSNSFDDTYANELVLNLLPPFASYGLCYGIYSHLCANMRVRLVPTYDPTNVDKEIIEFKPNRITLTPAHVECLNKSQLIRGEDLSFLHYPVVAGDTLAKKTEIEANILLEKNNCKSRIAKAYGLTECCGGVSFCLNNNVNKLLSVGVPLIKTTVAAFDVDDYNIELPFGESGEIAILSDNNMLGYLNREDETKKTLKLHSDGRVWLHTGDIGKIDKNGNLFIEGRFRRMIIQYCGLKSNPFEVEDVLTNHKLVKRVVVVGVNDPEHDQGELPVAFVEIDPSNFDKEEIIKKELIRMCEDRVTYYSIPIDYIFVDHYPETTRGKVDYRALSKTYNEMVGTRQIIPQRQLKI